MCYLNYLKFCFEAISLRLNPKIVIVKRIVLGCEVILHHVVYGILNYALKIEIQI